MRSLLHARSIEFTEAPSGLRATGLLGWVSLTYGDLDLDGLSLRRTRDGRTVLSFPEHRTSRGRVRADVRPGGPDVHAQIEAEVIADLRRQGMLS
jgi:hypothetical protein